MRPLRGYCFLMMSKRLAPLFDRSRRDLAFIKNCQAQDSDELKSCRAASLPASRCPPACLPTCRIGNRIERVDLKRIRAGKLRNAVLHNVSHAPRRRSRYDDDAKPQDRPPSARARVHIHTTHTPSPPSVDARTDNRYSVTPTLAGDKGLNGRPGQMHGLHRRLCTDVMHRPSPSI